MMITLNSFSLTRTLKNYFCKNCLDSPCGSMYFDLASGILAGLQLSEELYGRKLTGVVL